MNREFYQGQYFWNKSYEANFDPLTDEFIIKAEEKLGVKLPSTYLELLKEHNGGVTNYNRYMFPNSNSYNEIIHFSHMDGISLNDEFGIIVSQDQIKDFQLPENIIIIFGNGHNWVAFDYRNSRENPPIIYIEEIFLENGSNDKNYWQVTNLAPNFDHFLTGLFRLK